MNKKRISHFKFPYYSFIIGVSVVFIFLFDYYAIKAGQLSDGIGFISLLFVSPIGLVFGLKGLKNNKNRYVALLGVGINLSELLFLIRIMLVFAP